MKPWRARTSRGDAYKRVQSIRKMTRVVPFTNVRYRFPDLNKFNEQGRARRSNLAKHLRELRKWLQGDNNASTSYKNGTSQSQVPDVCSTGVHCLDQGPAGRVQDLSGGSGEGFQGRLQGDQGKLGEERNDCNLSNQVLD